MRMTRLWQATRSAPPRGARSGSEPGPSMDRVEVRRRGYALGAEITGVDLRGIDHAGAAAIRKALLEHVVLAFPGQPLSPAEFVAFAARFGELDTFNTRPRNRHPDYPEIYVGQNKPAVVEGKQQRRSSPANEWHSDYSSSRRPSTMTFLLAQEMPEIGGDTMFANLYMAYETLSPKLKEILEPLAAVHDVTLGAGYGSQDPAQQAIDRERNPPVVHSVIQSHPETGRKFLFVAERIRQFVGLTEEETRPLLRFLLAHATRYEFIYRHRWTVNDLVMWDDRCSLHYAVKDYDRDQLRRVLRTSTLAPSTGQVFNEETAPAVGAK